MDSRRGLESQDITLTQFLVEAELFQYYELIKGVLKVTKTSQLRYVDSDDLAQIGLSKPEIRRYRTVYNKLFPSPYMDRFKKLVRYVNNAIRVQNPSPNPTEPQPFSDNNVRVATKHIISIEDITLSKELGMGQFGVVQLGTWNTGKQRLQVAIKCLGHERMTSNSTEFLKEAAVMHSIDHPNVVRLFGVVLHLDNLMLVTELAPLRSLLECLREVSLRAYFPVPSLCDFAEQICDGMTYLEQKRLIHRDLAARNILVFNKNKVKISDFGLSRALGVGKDYYQTNYNVNLKLPVAWCAPECILYLRFTSASDVWAFGVCLWEMFTYGFQPWAAFSGQKILESIDAPNYKRLEKPECSPDAYYTTMLNCWEHETVDRPKFKDLCQTLRKIRPEQVQATKNYVKSEKGRRGNFLEYKSGQIITVLNKECSNSGLLWYGVVAGGACGVFDPNQTKPYYRPEPSPMNWGPSLPIDSQPFPKLRHNGPSGLAAVPSRSSTRSCRAPRALLSRGDVKRHTYQGKRTLQSSMISSPQGDVKHTGHVGHDGAYFGDIPFLDLASCSRITARNRPADDMETPLLLSPSHTKAGRCKPPYSTSLSSDLYEIILPYKGLLPVRSAYIKSPDTDDYKDTPDVSTRVKTSKRHSKNLDPRTSRSIISRMRNATLRRSRSEEGSSAFEDVVHEYHEISDTDTETLSYRAYSGVSEPQRNSPVVHKGNTDFSESLLTEVDSVFWSYINRGLERGSNRQSDSEAGARSMSLGKAEKKKQSDTGTMKPMSAQDMKTLDTAVALANEITSKSMSDLDAEAKAAKSPTEKRKILRNLKFAGVVCRHHHAHGHGSGKSERHSFSEEARKVLDIQASFSEESKQAYMSLVDEPKPSAAMRSQMTDDRSVAGPSRPPVKPKPTEPPPPPRPYRPKPKQAITRYKPRLPTPESSDDENDEQPINVLALPPRATKPKLVDKPRHVRRYPLKIPADEAANAAEQATDTTQRPIIYQNAVQRTKRLIQKNPVAVQNAKNKLDECDGASCDTNPFLNPVPGPSTANPFDRYQQAVEPEPIEIESSEPSGEPYSDLEDLPADPDVGQPPAAADEGVKTEEASALTDHVSVEDLLDVANQKPCGRQQGVESDKVRVMSKVLKEEIDKDTAEPPISASRRSGSRTGMVMRRSKSCE